MPPATVGLSQLTEMPQGLSPLTETPQGLWGIASCLVPSEGSCREGVSQGNLRGGTLQLCAINTCGTAEKNLQGTLLGLRVSRARPAR